MLNYYDAALLSLLLLQSVTQVVQGNPSAQSLSTPLENNNSRLINVCFCVPSSTIYANDHRKSRDSVGSGGQTDIINGGVKLISLISIRRNPIAVSARPILVSAPPSLVISAHSWTSSPREDVPPEFLKRWWWLVAEEVQHFKDPLTSEIMFFNNVLIEFPWWCHSLVVAGMGSNSGILNSCPWAWLR